MENRKYVTIFTYAFSVFTVIVGYKPFPVQDFECIVYNDEILTCTWTAPENLVNTSYELTYFLPGQADRPMTNNCTNFERLLDIENRNRLRCSWTIQTEPSSRPVELTFFFRLKMNDIFGTTQKNYSFSHVFFGPPGNFTEISATAESVYLRWVVPIAMRAFLPGLEHRVFYRSEYENEWQLGGILDTAKAEGLNFVYFNLTNLKYANALYDVLVSMRSRAAELESMWSTNYSTITIKTKSKLPGGPPMTNIGSFEIVSSGTALNQSEVFIYWQQIPASMKNGHNFTYVVEVVGQSNIERVEVTNAYAKFKSLSVDENYTFNVWSQNCIGRSKEKSIIFVPSQFIRVGEPSSFTKIAFDDGKFELSWEPPPPPPPKRSVFYNSRITSYTIFWCTDDMDRPYRCTGYLSWVEIPSDQTIYNITLPEDKIHQFAISANTVTTSSGMVWAACTVIHNEAVGKMKNVRIAQVYSTAIQIAWILDCSERVGSVRGFVIYYCSIVKPSSINCEGPEEKLLVTDTTAEQANITGLKPYESYVLAVSLITKGNGESQRSDRRYATTLEGAPSPPYGIKIINVTNSSISVSWNRPNATNGKLQCYRVLYNDGSGTVRADVTEYTVNHLLSDVIYNVSVIACTSHCSVASESRPVRTIGEYPGKTSPPGVTFQNDSFILIEWNSIGKNDEFQVKLQNGIRTNPIIINVTGTKFGITDCGDDEQYDTFYVSVRAVDIIDGKGYEGPWSDELESVCQPSKIDWGWLLITLILMLVLYILYCVKKNVRPLSC